MPVVVRVADAAVDLRRGEDEAAALAEGDDLVHGHDVVRHGSTIYCARLPIYEYRCENGHLFEVMRKITEPPLTECQECDAPVVKVLHSPAVHFKGSGFYNTDYGTAKRKRELDKSASDGADKNDAKQKDKQETKKAETKTDSKPASSTPSGTS